MATTSFEPEKEMEKVFFEKDFHPHHGKGHRVGGSERKKILSDKSGQKKCLHPFPPSSLSLPSPDLDIKSLSLSLSLSFHFPLKSPPPQNRGGKEKVEREGEILFSLQEPF